MSAELLGALLCDPWWHVWTHHRFIYKDQIDASLAITSSVVHIVIIKYIIITPVVAQSCNDGISSIVLAAAMRPFWIHISLKLMKINLSFHQTHITFLLRQSSIRSMGISVFSNHQVILLSVYYFCIHISNVRQENLPSLKIKKIETRMHSSFPEPEVLPSHPQYSLSKKLRVFQLSSQYLKSGNRTTTVQ